MDDLNIGDEVIYKGQKVLIVDHYGAGNYCVEVDGEWKSVHRNDLSLENDLIKWE